MSGAAAGPGTITGFSVFSADLPFRLTFRHAAAARQTSSSVFIECRTSSGASGWGECLPREYVTGETQAGTYELLRDELLPRLIGRSFDDFAAVRAFLQRCNGSAPNEWGLPPQPHTAAWCAIDLALLDAFGHHFRRNVVAAATDARSSDYRYSAVLSATGGWPLLKTALKLRLFGISEVKVKLGSGVDIGAIRTISRLLGSRADVRVDLNMMWSLEEALRRMPEFDAAGVRSFEQPLPADDIAGMAALVEQTGFRVMADESFSDAGSLAALVRARACNAVNVRISKCGGLIAAIERCKSALEAGFLLQVGCQVGESSLLSAAQLALMAEVAGIRYLEGCFGTRLLERDPVSPELRFQRGGRAPMRPAGFGFGVALDRELLRACSGRDGEVH